MSASQSRSARDTLETRSARAVALCASSFDVEAASEVAGALVVPVTAAAAAQCRRAGIEYRRLEDVAGPEDARRVTALVSAGLRDLTAVVDSAVRDRLGPEGGAFAPTAASHLVLFNILAELHLCAAATERLLERLQPAELLVWPPRGHVVPPSLALRHSALPLIAADVGRRGDVRVVASPGEIVPAPTASTDAGGIPRGLRRLVRRLRPPARRGPPAALFVGLGYDLDDVSSGLASLGWKVTRLAHLPEYGSRPSASARNVSALTAAALADEEARRPLVRLGIDDLGLLHEVLSTWSGQFVPLLWEAYADARDRFRRGRYSLAIAAEAGGGSLAAPIMQAAEAAGVPRVIYQHGSTFRVDAARWEGWLRHADRLLLYGHGTAGLLAETGSSEIAPRTERVPVGSARLDRLRADRTGERPQPRSRRTVLYVPTIFGGWGRGVSDLVGLPDVPYFELQAELIQLLRKHGDVQFVYKPAEAANAAENPITELVREELGPAAVNLESRLTDLVWDADGIVVNHPITALAEAVLTDAPLVVYVPSSCETTPEGSHALELLRRRARVAQHPADFLAAVDDLLRGGVASRHDAAFRRRYATHLDDCRSAERAITACVELANGARSR